MIFKSRLRTSFYLASERRKQNQGLVDCLDLAAGTIARLLGETNVQYFFPFSI